MHFVRAASPLQLAQRSEARANLLRKEFRLFPRRKVPALSDFVLALIYTQRIGHSDGADHNMSFRQPLKFHLGVSALLSDGSRRRFFTCAAFGAQQGEGVLRIEWILAH